MGLGLRYCKQHEGEPLMLVSKRNGTYWRCEHPSGCTYTENALKLGGKVTHIAGRSVRVASRNQQFKYADQSPSLTSDDL
jgi:hypothetical protein